MLHYLVTLHVRACWHVHAVVDVLPGQVQRFKGQHQSRLLLAVLGHHALDAATVPPAPAWPGSACATHNLAEQTCMVWGLL